MASAVSESVLVFAAFVLYVMWDHVAKIMQSKDYYINAQAKPWDHGRRVVTVVCAVVAAGIAVLAAVIQRKKPGEASWVIGIDIALIVLLIAYRAAKELWRSYKKNRLARASPTVTTQGAQSTDEAPAPLDLLGRLSAIEEKLDLLLPGEEQPKPL